MRRLERTEHVRHRVRRPAGWRRRRRGRCRGGSAPACRCASRRRAQQRQQHALAGVAVARILRAGVVDQQVARVRTSTAVPWPTSAASTSNRPVGGHGTGGRSSGSTSGTASARSRHGSGTPPAARRQQARQRAQSGAAGTVQTAPGQAASHASARTSRLHHPSRPAYHSGGSSTPSSASGVITSVTSGIATRLATKPTSDTCWKNTSVSGVSPRVATSCVRSHGRRHAAAPAPRPRMPAAPRRRRRCTSSDDISRPTATNDNQKPGCNSAQGSPSVTTTAAASSTSGQGQRRRRLRSSHGSQHPHRALRRHAPAGEQRIGERQPPRRPSAPPAAPAATASRARCAARPPPPSGRRARRTS